jgi:hypothetical protein
MKKKVLDKIGHCWNQSKQIKSAAKKSSILESLEMSVCNIVDEATDILDAVGGISVYGKSFVHRIGHAAVAEVKSLGAALASTGAAKVLARTGRGDIRPVIGMSILTHLASTFVRGFVNDIVSQGKGIDDSSWENSLRRIGKKQGSIQDVTVRLQEQFKKANEEERKQFFRD